MTSFKNWLNQLKNWIVSNNYASWNLCCATNQYIEIIDIFLKILDRSVSSMGMNISVEVISFVKKEFNLVDEMEYI